jgi:hypothetical protein
MASRWVWRVHILKDVAVPDENALPNHTFQGVGLSRPWRVVGYGESSGMASRWVWRVVRDGESLGMASRQGWRVVGCGESTS